MSTRKGDTPPLIEAVIKNNVDEVFRLLQAGESVNVVDAENNTPLHHAVYQCPKNTTVFDRLIEVENIQLNAVNSPQKTPLLIAVGKGQPDALYYIRKLLEKGADPNLRYLNNGKHLLHKTVNVAVVKLLMEHGADINAQDDFGCTPLFDACKNWKRKDCIDMYLYYGADVTIKDDRGFLPIDVCRETPESLFYATFDQYTKISLYSLYQIIVNNAQYLVEIVKFTKDIAFTKKQFNELVESYGITVIQHLTYRLLHEKVPPTMEICRLVNSETDTPVKVTIEDFLIISFEYYWRISLDDYCFCLFVHTRAQLNFFTKLCCYFASNGTSIDYKCMNAIYKRFGFCDLYRFLMSYVPVEIRKDVRFKCKAYANYLGCSLVALLNYNLNLDIEILRQFQLNEYGLHESCFAELLNFFNLVRFKDQFLCPFKQFKIGKSMPSLVELSRNTARKFIISKFDVKDTAQFFTIVRKLPISNILKQIITYEKPIYV